MRIGMKQSLYNAEIRNRRKQLGLTLKQLAAKLGVHYVSIAGAERFKLFRTDSPIILKLAEFFGTSPEVLYPPWIRVLKTFPLVRDIQKEFSEKALYSISQKYEKITWQRDVNRQEIKEMVEKAIPKLSPRQQEIMKLKFGLFGEREHSFYEIATKFSITRERIRQIVNKCLRKLRHMHETKVIDLGENDIMDIGSEEESLNQESNGPVV